MRKSGTEYIASYLYIYLKEHSDRDHRLTTAQICSFLEENDLPSERRSVYKAVDILRSAGADIRYQRSRNSTGFWLEGRFTPAECLFLKQSAETSYAISPEGTKKLSEKIGSLLSEHQRRMIGMNDIEASKTDNPHVLEYADILITAASRQRIVEFMYYDLTLNRVRTYRGSDRKYRMMPYGVVTDNGRYYCIMYSKEHGSFVNFRIDKMDRLELTGETEQRKPFDLQSHMRSSFRMYHGEAQTVIIRFNINMAQIVLDEFGTDMIITAVDDRSFTAALRTAVTPTLIGWLLQFEDRLTVLSPAETINKLRSVAVRILASYPEEEENNGRQDPGASEDH
ncbi:MAG: WYL domain-containing protein [Solobacterium sp.]|nr:WYL domain-containing protein [Solobacterium sp.]